MSFYRVFGRNCPFKMIDGYDGTVHRGPFRLSCRRRILMDGQDEVVEILYKNALDHRRWIAIRCFGCIPRD